MATVDLLHVNRYVLRKQHLIRDSGPVELAKVVGDICGLHGTCPTTPYLSLFSRGAISSKEQLEEAMYGKKSLVRAGCMRGTLYVLPPDLLAIAYSALKAPMISACAGYCRRRGISNSDYADLSTQVLEILEGGGLTATEIKRKIETKLNMSPILVLMCDQGLIVRGSPKGGWASNKHTYHLFGQYLPGVDLSRPGEQYATGQLILAYLESFGPATETDIAWWTGLPKSNVRKGLADINDLISFIDISGIPDSCIITNEAENALLAKAEGQDDVVNLLPTMDGYIMGYKERTRYLDDEYYGCVFDRSGNAANTILHNGRIIGVWDTDTDNTSCVKFYLFEEPGDGILKMIRAQAKELGTFVYGKPVTVTECKSMTPLTDKPSGGVMSPLKGN